MRLERTDDMSQMHLGGEIGRDQSAVSDFLYPYDGILCFGGEDWWYHNQAHFDMQIMRCMARRVPVLYVNSVGFAMPSVQEGAHFLTKIGRKLRSVSRPISMPSPGFHVASPFSAPLWHRPNIAKLNVLSLRMQVHNAVRSVGFKNPLIWVACPTAYEVVRCMRRQSFLVYQRTDKYEEYSEQTRGYIESADRWLSTRADLTVYASRTLYEESPLRPKSLLVSHGVELAHFDRPKALQAGPPPDITNLKRPIVGFFGDIEGNTTVDMDLIARVGHVLSNVSFVFVGRVVTNLGAVRDLPNVYFLGKKPYEDVPRYGAQFDVAIMPWKQNRWIHYCNPIKLKEYLALGLPIVTTEFPEALHYRDVMYVARSRDEFINGIREAVRGRPVGTVESRRARVAGDTWEQATLRIAETIRKLRGTESKTSIAYGSKEHISIRRSS